MFGPLTNVLNSTCNALIKFATVAEVTADMCLNVVKTGEVKSNVMLQEEQLKSEEKLYELKQKLIAQRASQAVLVSGETS